MQNVCRFNLFNKACARYSFPLSHIDQLIDFIVGHDSFSFMDAYTKYNQILMCDPNQTSFITNQGLFCYKVIPFGLKNHSATCQSLVNKIFSSLIRQSMDIYVNDIIVKSKVTSFRVGMSPDCRLANSSGFLKYSFNSSNAFSQFQPLEKLDFPRSTLKKSAHLLVANKMK